MGFAQILDAAATTNLLGIRLALHDRELARRYMSRCLRLFDELMGRGLPGKDPVQFLYEQRWARFSPDNNVLVPPLLGAEGGTQLDEQVYLATVTRVLRPQKIFEIGTYMGRTTSLLILNAQPDTTVVSLDLPPEHTPDAAANAEYIDTDLELVRGRKLAYYVHQLGLASRYQQLLCDSLTFDPEPHRGTVELGFIDGAHSRRYVENDTLKMATMTAERGLVFWHDYGGKGRFRPLTEYLESLAGKITLYRVPNTSLAWTTASELRKLA